jgi:hypothetical protein
MMKIGARTVIDARQLLIPLGERAEYSVDVEPGSPFKITLEVDSADDIPGGTSGVTWNGGVGFVNLVFKTNSLAPQLTKSVHQIANISDGSALVFAAEFFRPRPTMAVVFLQLMKEKEGGANGRE